MAIRLDPDDADAYAARAEAFEAQGKTIEAERDRARAEQTGAESGARQTLHRDGIIGADAMNVADLR